jgi:hypothetical protein
LNWPQFSGVVPSDRLMSAEIPGFLRFDNGDKGIRVTAKLPGQPECLGDHAKAGAILITSMIVSVLHTWNIGEECGNRAPYRVLGIVFGGRMVAGSISMVSRRGSTINGFPSTS